MVTTQEPFLAALKQHSLAMCLMTFCLKHSFRQQKGTEVKEELHNIAKHYPVNVPLVTDQHNHAFVK